MSIISKTDKDLFLSIMFSSISIAIARIFVKLHVTSVCHNVLRAIFIKNTNII